MYMKMKVEVNFGRTEYLSTKEEYRLKRISENDALTIAGTINP